MTVEGWDPDQAVLLSTSEGDDDLADAAPVRRYGVTGWESCHHEPLSVALSQEVPDGGPDVLDDDIWRDVDDDARFPGRLLADVQENDDDLAVAVVDPEDYAAEELAMHIVEV
jgi:hypothetical protein